jgi:predicted nucleic acid-binding protein
MSHVFVDTSAFLALLLRDDRRHADAQAAFATLARENAAWVSSSYVMVECYALLHRRVGPVGTKAMREHLAPLVQVTWVDEALHEAGLDRLQASAQRRVSLVDCVSFELMQAAGMHRAFAYDRHFNDAGFETVS